LNRPRWITLGIVVALVAVAVVWWRVRGAPDKPRFRTAAVEQGRIESVVSATGTVRPVTQVEVGSQVSGTVAELYADFNSRVRKGQVLCQLDPASFRARAVQAEAAVSRAEAALLDAQRQFRRAKELLPQNYVSQADVEAAEVAVKQREADLKQARAQLDVARVDLANTTIRAPIDGVVISRSIDRGQTVAASLQAPRLFVIANDLQSMQIETRIDESDIGVIHRGLPSTFTVDAYPDLTFRGEVDQVRLEPITEQNVVTYTTVITTRNPDLRLRPGMTANVSVLIARRDDVTKVPNAALRFRPPGEARAGGRGAAGEGGRAAGGTAPGGAGVAAAGERERAAGGAAPGGTGVAAAGERERAGAGLSGGRGGDGTRSGRGGRGRRPGASADSVRRGAGDPGLEAAAPAAPAFKPGVVFVLRGGKPVAVKIRTGITDGAFTEVQSGELRPGDEVLVGLDVSTRGDLTPPPGMGGPMMGRGGGGRR
jgi:HlyD family secretion protein